MKHKILLTFSLIASTLSFGQFPCTGFNGDEHDFAMDYWKTVSCNVTPSSSPYIPPGRSTNPLDGTGYVYITDYVGSSIYYNDVKYVGMGSSHLGDCLCFDYVIYNDGDPTTTHYIHPRIYLTWGTKTIYFEATATVDEISKNWVRVCAPIQNYDMNLVALPSNSDGSWHVGAGTSFLDFNNVMNFCDKVYFDIDVVGSSYQTETIGIDNVCIKACNCEFTNTNYDFTLHYNTDPLSAPLGALPNGINVVLNSYNSTYTYEYSWGDGTVTTGSLASASHAYASPGTYTFKLSRLNTSGDPACNSTSTVFCIPVSSQYAVTTGGYNPPVSPICNSGFNFVYHYNTDPLVVLTPSNLATVTINSPHPGSTYTYNWGSSIPPVVTPSSTATYMYGFGVPVPNPIQICVEESNGNDDGFCKVKSCLEMCSPVSYQSTEFYRLTNAALPESANNKVELYPNPASDNVTLDCYINSSAEISFALLDVIGKQVFTEQAKYYEAGNHKIYLNVSDIPSGVYYARIKIGNNTTTKRLTITK